jgi:hypothetical protein
MSSAPRIVVVDASHDVARIVYGALTLLNRQHILVEVPTAEDALEEVTRSPIALVVTAHKIPGSMHGIELATRIIHESLGTPVIVLAEEGDPLPDDPALKDVPFQYFMRPVAEPFLRGLRIALDGEAAIAVEQVETQAVSELGSVPSINIKELRNIVLSLMRDVGAMGVILADRTGRVLVDEGATGYVDREKLAIILGPSFARSADISPLIGGNAWTMQYYDGERLDVFGLALGIHYFMCLIFEGSNRGAFGAVTMFGRRAADQMIDMIGAIAYKTKEPAEPELPPQPKAKPSKEKEKREVVAEAPPAHKPAAPKKEELFEAAASQTGEAGDLDVDALFGQSIDEGLAASMFDPEKLGDLAEALESDEDEHVGYDEAIDMGILGE